MAHGHYDGDPAECTMFELQIQDDDQEHSRHAMYSEFCLNFDDIKWEDWHDSNPHEWCDTFRAAIVWIVAMVFGVLFSCMGSCWVSPFCIIGRCCCPHGCPRVLFVVALLLCIFGNVMWVTNDRVCQGVFGMSTGSSLELAFAACAAILCACICAK